MGQTLICGLEFAAGNGPVGFNRPSKPEFVHCSFVFVCVHSRIVCVTDKIARQNRVPGDVLISNLFFNNELESNSKELIGFGLMQQCRH
jgi:hypothetical protein